MIEVEASSDVAAAPDPVRSAGGPRRPLLFDALPALEGRLAHVPLADGVPTPVEPLEALGRAASVADLWVKRDDRTSALYGGNKVRKLEWILGEVLRTGHRGVLTFGAYGSHHALATALFARRVGLTAYLALFPQPVTPHVVKNLKAGIGAGARVVPLCTVALVPLGRLLVAGRARREGAWPLAVVPAGGTDARGVLGYVEAGLELAAQVEAGALPCPRQVYAPVGTGGTVGGLAIGLALGARRVPDLARATVRAVRVVPAALGNRFVIGHAVRRTLALLRRLLGPTAARELPRPAPLSVIGGELGRGYGHPTEAGERALALAREHAGLTLEPTYTAKAMAGLLREAPRLEGPHVFVHTLSSAPLEPLAAGVPDDALPAVVRARASD